MLYTILCRYVLALTARRAEAKSAREALILEQATIINNMEVNHNSSNSKASETTFNKSSSENAASIASQAHSESHTHTGEVAVTFSEVVEAFAAEHGVEFKPRSGRTYLGRQIYAFNGVSIYLDNTQSVAYTEIANKWGPIALQDLLQYSQNKKKAAASK